MLVPFGRVTDEAGTPLADVEVSLGNVEPASGGRYESPVEYTARTDAEGRFRIEGLPAGTAAVWVRKPGHVRPGLGLPIATPAADVELQMIRSASLRVTVDFAGTERPEGYIVNLEPEGGNVVGSHGGSGNIDDQGQMAFENMPPGRYVVWGRPNPGSDAEQTESVTVELHGGQAAEVTLKAK
jgi:Carboxypeptidase regulatory-like domain